MKYSKYILVLFLSFYLSMSVLAQDEEGGYSKTIFLGSSITYHPFIEPDEGRKLENKLSSDGEFIHNFRVQFTMEQLTENEGYVKHSFHLLQDCVGSPAAGYTYSIGWTRDEDRIGLMFGGYFINNNEWNKRGLGDYWAETGTSKGFVPLIGIEVLFNVYKFDNNFRIDFQNAITPVITNHALLFGWDF